MRRNEEINICEFEKRIALMGNGEIGEDSHISVSAKWLFVGIRVIEKKP